MDLASGTDRRVPEAYEVLDKQALAARLGLSVASVSYYLSTEPGSVRRLPPVDGRVSGSPFWYRVTVEKWLEKARREENRRRTDPPPRLPRARSGGGEGAGRAASEGEPPRAD